MYVFAVYLTVFPLFGFLINGIFGKKLNSEKVSGFIGAGVVGASFLVALLIFIDMLKTPVDDRSHLITLFNWITAGSFSVDAAYQIDQLSILMTLIVTGVGLLIHVYSIGYMRGDPAFWRFFSYLNLFIFMMLNLVLANNFLLMFLGWEGVGLCSYLLIGFWHDKKFETGGYKPGTATTSDAAKKAFIVNRIGDFGFLIAMFLIFNHFGSLKFEEVFSKAAAITQSGDRAMFWITLLLFLGATGKSAQIPLFVWLPDAMAGPTPVSALIHAATMVTAGVYMVARCSLFYALAPATMEIVAVIGIATAFLAATMALVQNDIKKVLAYSTISQLGYMFLGLGVGGFSSGIFHVMTHAFFKALLFLGAGSVIHSLHDEQDITRMGGLKSKMPATYTTFLIAALAIAGIPPLSGFFSKDEILFLAFSQGSVIFWLLGWMTAAMTAFYMFRLVVLTFEGDERWSHEKQPHESPKVMTIPLMILAGLSIIGGFVGIPLALGGNNAIEHWLAPIFEPATSRLSIVHDTSATMEYLLMILSVTAGVLGIVFARSYFSRKENIQLKPARVWYTLLWNKYYVDEIYDFTIVTPAVQASQKLLWKGIDINIIDGMVNGTAKLVAMISSQLRKIQVGVTQGYAFAFVVGIIIVLGILIFK
jgi:NADH-quinone oxidoreductase subunit L